MDRQLKRFLGTSLIFVATGCGGGTTTPPDGAVPSDAATGNGALVGRWGGQTTVDDLTFAPGRDVRLDEVVEFGADGAMRGDFAGIDAVTRCVVTYQLTGTYELAAGAPTLDARWSSIRVATAGCTDPLLNHAAADVTAAEGTLWDGELDGTWSVANGRLVIQSSDHRIDYARVESPLVSRWAGQSTVDDLTFAPGREVTLSEVFWLNTDGTLAAYFAGTDATSGCTVDYRLSGTWTSTAANQLDAQWTAIFATITGCTDATQNTDNENVTADEATIWNDELDGLWTVSGSALSIQNTAGGTVEYTRAL